MIGRFFVGADATAFLETAVRAALKGREDRASSAEIDAVFAHLRAVQLYAPFGENLGRREDVAAAYDVDAWLAATPRRALREFAYEAPRRFVAAVASEKRTSIETRLRTFGENPQGMGKFTRTMFARDFRRTLAATDDVAISSAK